MALHMLLLLNFLVAISSSTASDLLQNSDFESPPTGITASNATTPVLLMESNNIPSRSFGGIVFHVTSGLDVSLPDNSHGILLGRGGKINQMFRGDGETTDYVLTFTLAPGNEACPHNFTASEHQMILTLWFYKSSETCRVRCVTDESTDKNNIMLSNNGFEVGPAFLGNSNQGILLQEEPDQERLESLLQQWLTGSG
ncbi:uncharacterized protein LOC115749330 [Rhodamnia argentea]|uniref:Uncharacterized protein LOC115749330 n=1 Tax=Rhodamnia argentea TaxID=178133 RepID=A0A8B8Q4C8_9MYRT|nr:uncharacterized protein LOC115749330 [Rhodamnia argentea]